MAEHMNSLHISSDYTSFGNKDPPNVGETMDAEPSTSNYNQTRMVTQDLKDKLRKAQRITICDEIRKIKNESLLPNALLERIERPCTALVLWQPPQRTTNDVSSSPSRYSNENVDMDKETVDDDLIDNNNSSSIDFNNTSMDLDL